MTEEHNGDVGEVQSADVKRAGLDLRFWAWILLGVAIGAVLVVIGAILGTHLRERRIQTNESKTIANIRAITAAQTYYSEANKLYAHSFVELTDTANGGPFLDPDWFEEVPQWGYTFKMEDTSGIRYCYEVNADPVEHGRTGIRYFYSNCSGVIAANVSEPASSVDFFPLY